MELNLEGKTALITGGSRGIGLAIKKTLEKEGIKVISVSRAEGYDLGKINYRNIRQVCEMVKDVDILINNFGGGGTWKKDWEEVMHRNIGLTIQLTKSYLLKPRNWGRVVTISSIYGKEKGHNPIFTSSKSAQIAYMKSLAGTYKNITFNCIAPGYIDVNKPFPSNPKIIGKPDDVANLVTFLCSPLASHINGACITCDGGESHSF